MADADVVIRVEGLGKKYSLHHEKSERYTALRDVVARQARAAGRLLNPFTLAGQLRQAQRQAAQQRTNSDEEFWALKDVSFEIRRGERVGIIGRNGAGKSTLLKILSRITEPSTGRVEIRGRVASLLEVGTGFHPELTGRENIYLNGAILGMNRREIRAKFDEIVDFAEVEKFLDTPVKRYSSGMYVRLAFAVAAHLEPEILVVDEVLAVGDASFQKKCLGKMESVAENEGRTILFVSHQMSAIKRLCSKGILIHKGRIEQLSTAEAATATYLSSTLSENDSFSNEKADRFRRKGDTHKYFQNVWLDKSECQTNESLTFHLELSALGLRGGTLKPFIEVTLKNDQGDSVLSYVSLWDNFNGQINGNCCIQVFIQALPLTAGGYTVYLLLSDGQETIECIPSACRLHVTDGVSTSGVALQPRTGCQVIGAARWTMS